PRPWPARRRRGKLHTGARPARRPSSDEGGSRRAAPASGRSWSRSPNRHRRPHPLARLDTGRTGAMACGADLYLRGRGHPRPRVYPGGSVSMIRFLARAGAPVLVILAIAGCGSSSSSTTTSSTTATTATTASGPVAAIAEQVPAAIKSKGTLVVGTEAQYAPNEFLASDGHTIIGMDPDLVTALAETMGLKAKFNDAQFEAIIPGIQAGRYDMGASSFTDTKEREEKVDF